MDCRISTTSRTNSEYYFFILPNGNIKVNPQKFTLIFNSIYTPSISFLHQNIQCQPSKTPFKFLECWFSTSSKSTKQSKLITQEATELINTLDTKQIIDKQACYIINNIIIPI